MKSTLIFLFSFFAFSSFSYAQKYFINFSMHGSSSHILFIKDRPADNFYVGVSGAYRNYHFSPKIGFGVQYLRPFSEKKNLSYGIGLRYTEKGQNITYFDTSYILSNLEFNNIGGLHKASLYYLQVPFSLHKQWNLKKHSYALQFSLAPEFKVYGKDNYEDLYWPHLFGIDALSDQKSFGLSSRLNWQFNRSMKHQNAIFFGVYAEFQLTRYWRVEENQRERAFQIKDPESVWIDYTHLARTHLFNLGVEVGYTFGFMR